MKAIGKFEHDGAAIQRVTLEKYGKRLLPEKMIICTSKVRYFGVHFND